MQRRTAKIPPKDQGFVAELSGDIVTDSRVGRSSGCQNRGLRGEGQQVTGQALIIGSKVEAPIRNTVSLVDDHQSGTGQESG